MTTEVFSSPNQIKVLEPNHLTGDSTYRVRMITGLFRADCFLPQSMDLAYASNPEGVKVLSAGCSNGAEVDSTLALHRKSCVKGEISAIGLDFNAKAIRAARAAKYIIEESLDLKERDWMVQDLLDYGFEVGESRTGYSPYPEKSYRLIKSDRLRQGKTVDFTQFDLRERLPESIKADLVLCNNVLCHGMDTETTTAIVCNLARTVTATGILSLGFMGEESQGRWGRRLASKLDRDFGMERVTDTEEEHLVYART